MWTVNDNMKTWATLDQLAIQTCADREGSPNFNMDKCVHDAGADQTMFRHEHTTPARYWSEALGLSFAIGLVLTALVVSAFFVARWVIREFRTET
jgi:hypothetical protein